MRIAVLGWGSLVWCPRNLCVASTWFSDGPTLHLEFSRVSEDCRLTLVIDPENGVPVSALWAESTCATVDEAVKNLKSRERTPDARNIGFVDCVRGCSRARLRDVKMTIESWARDHELDAVIWTDLAPNFPSKPGMPFSVENALRYLECLDSSKREKALEYFRKAPSEVDTPLRSAVNSRWLLNDC